MTHDTVKMLRKGISAEEKPDSCHDLRLCGVDVFESVLHSNDTQEQKIEKLNYLNELYLVDKDTFNKREAKNMEDLMTLFAEVIDREPKKPTTYE